MKKPKFSIIIPLRRINNYILEAIPYFKKQTFKDFEIIIVCEEDAGKKIPGAKIIKVGRIPPAAKRNTGVKNARGEILAFIDDDAYPEKDWLKKAEIIFQDKEIFGLGGPSLVPKNATFFQRVSNKVYELSSKTTGKRYGRARRCEIDDWPTCNFFVRKDIFIKVSGFDEKYWGAEDTILGYRIRNKGKKIIYDPDVIVYHHPRKTLMQHLKQTFFWGMWRGFLMKIYPKNSIKLTFFIPALFILWIVVGGVLALISKCFSYVYLASILLYLLFLLMTGLKTKSFKLFLPVVVLTSLTQIAYGLGFIKGIFSKEPTKKTFNPQEKIKLK